MEILLGVNVVVPRLKFGIRTDFVIDYKSAGCWCRITLRALFSVHLTGFDESSFI